MKTVLLILLALVLVACGGDKAVNVVGKWVFDPDTATGSIVDEAKAQSRWPELGNRLKEQVFIFEPDYTFKVESPGKSGEAGKWKVDGENVIITATSPSEQNNVPAFKLDETGTRMRMTSPGSDFQCDLFRAPTH